MILGWLLNFSDFEMMRLCFYICPVLEGKIDTSLKFEMLVGNPTILRKETYNCKTTNRFRWITKISQGVQANMLDVLSYIIVLQAHTHNFIWPKCTLKIVMLPLGVYGRKPTNKAVARARSTLENRWIEDNKE